MLFEGNVAKGVLSEDRFSELLTAKRIEFPNITVEEIEDRSKSDGFSKTTSGKSDVSLFCLKSPYFYFKLKLSRIKQKKIKEIFLKNKEICFF